MPKKKIKKQKKTKDKKKKPEKKIKIDFKPDLEEAVEDTEEQIQDNQFHKFMRPTTKSTTPVLEKVGIQEEQTLEQEITQTPIEKKQEPEIKQEEYDINDYEAVAQKARQIKNQDLLVQSTPISMEMIGKQLHLPVQREFQINPELKQMQSARVSEEDYTLKAEKLQESKNLPFEQTERKYKGKSI